MGSTMDVQSDYLTVMGIVFQRKAMPVVDSCLAIQNFRRAIGHLLASQLLGRIVIEVNP